MDDLRTWYAVLELEEGASPESVDRAYRELSRVWHPDRFASDSPSMQERAQRKQQEVNAAYERLVAARDQSPDLLPHVSDSPPAEPASDITVPPAAGPPVETVRGALSRVSHLVSEYVVPALQTAVIPAILRRLTSGSGDGQRSAENSPCPGRWRARDGRGAGRGSGRSGRGGNAGRGRRR